MRLDTLTHTLTVRVPPSLRDDLAAAAERKGLTYGAYIRRMVQAELRATSGKIPLSTSAPASTTSRAG